jgi:hypothetical protein
MRSSVPATHFIPPRDSGEGGPSAACEASEGWWEGRAPSTACGGPPPPLRFTSRGRTNKSVPAARFFAPEFCQPRRSVGWAKAPTGPARSGRPDDRLRAVPTWPSRVFQDRVGFACAQPTLLRQTKGSGTPADAGSFMPARKRRAGRATEKGGLRRPPLAGALACRRSTTVLAGETFVPRAQLQARLPEGGAKAAACRTRRHRLQRSTSRAGPSAGGHDARAARVRTANPRAGTALAPCSGVPREHDPYERDSLHSIRNGAACQWKSDTAHCHFLRSSCCKPVALHINLRQMSTFASLL